MITISLCMIVKNEEENLPRCLNTVAGVFDEVIIVDTGSTDRTVEIAKNYTAQVYPFIWTEDFSAARNFSFSKAKMEYCMWLDADDILTPEDRKALIVLKETLSKKVDCVMMKYQGVPFSPREEFYYGRELYDNREYQKAARQLEQFLENPDGWTENKIEACRILANCSKSNEQALYWLFHSFAYSLPRAETCCDIGWRFFQESRYEQAIYWYEHALSTPRDDQSGAFVLPDCYGFIPAVQLCVCYDRLGNHTVARFYHDLSGTIHPESDIYQYNQAYFEMLAQKEKEAG